MFDRITLLTDYRQWLKEQYELRRDKNPKYSLRSFARDLKVSNTAIRETISKQRHLSKRNAHVVADALGLETTDKELLLKQIPGNRKTTDTCVPIKQAADYLTQQLLKHLANRTNTAVGEINKLLEQAGDLYQFLIDNSQASTDLMVSYARWKYEAAYQSELNYHHGLAIAQSEESIEILESLNKRSSTLSVKKALCEAYIYKSYFENNEGSWQEEVAHLEKTESMIEEVLALESEQEGSDLIPYYSWVVFQQGHVLRQQGFLKGLQEKFIKSMEIVRPFLGKNNLDLELLQSLARAEVSLGLVLIECGKKAEALSRADNVVHTCSDIFGVKSALYPCATATTCVALASQIYDQADQLEKAQSSSALALRIAKEIYAQDSSNIIYAEALASAHMYCGKVRKSENRQDEAQQEFEQAFKLFDKITKDGTKHYQFKSVYSQYELLRLYLEKGQPCDQVLELLTAVKEGCKLQPDSHRWLSLLADCQQLMTKNYLAHGKRANAQDSLVSSMQCRCKLLSVVKHNPTWRSRLQEELELYDGLKRSARPPSHHETVLADASRIVQQ